MVVQVQVATALLCRAFCLSPDCASTLEQAVEERGEVAMRVEIDRWAPSHRFAAGHALTFSETDLVRRSRTAMTLR